MPITLVAGSNLAAAVVSGGNPTLTWPTLAPNDVAFVIAAHRHASIDPALSTSGYTLADSHSSGAARRAAVWYKVMGASPDASVTATGTGDVDVVETLAGVVLRGVDISTPLDATPTHTNNNSTNPDSPSITTVTDLAWVLSMAYSQVDDATITAPSGYSNGVTATATDVWAGSVGVATKSVTPAGAEDPPAWTNWSTSQWLSFSIAVRPSRPGGMVMRYTN